MNQFKAEIIKIDSVDMLTSITFSLNKEFIKMLSLELEPNLIVGKVVNLTIKSTHIAIAKDLKGLLSFENRLKGVVVSITDGELLSSICLDIDGFLSEVIISLDSRRSMNLQIEDNVLVLINSMDISIVNREY